MSFILDALKRAEAERDRGRVPGLNASTPTLATEEPEPARHLPSWVWALLGALMMLVAALVWILMERDTPAHDAAPPAENLASTGTAPSPSPSPPRPTIPSQAGGVVNASATAQAGVRSSRSGSSWTYNAPPETPQPSGSRLQMSVPAGQAVRQPDTTQAAPPAGDAHRIYAVQELPPEIQQALPSLQFGGAMYSEHAASRLLIINGQALHEGDRVQAGLTLKEIKLRSAVLEFRGYAYTVNY
jgi:general secretion pathway protein B